MNSKFRTDATFVMVDLQTTSYANGSLVITDKLLGSEYFRKVAFSLF
jgi:hypothetical protein